MATGPPATPKKTRPKGYLDPLAPRAELRTPTSAPGKGKRKASETPEETDRSSPVPHSVVRPKKRKVGDTDKLKEGILRHEKVRRAPETEAEYKKRVEERETRRQRYVKEGTYAPPFQKYGVFMVDRSEQTERNRNAAGYLNLRDATDFEGLLSDSKFAPVVEETVRLFHENFEQKEALTTAKKPKKIAWKVVQLGDLCEPLSTGTIHPEDIVSDGVPPDQRYPRTTAVQHRQALYVLRFIWAAITRFPGCFTGPCQSDKSHTYTYLEIEAEDINRGLILWNLIRRRETEKRGGKATNRGFYKGAAILPVFYDVARELVDPAELAQGNQAVGKMIETMDEWAPTQIMQDWCNSENRSSEAENNALVDRVVLNRTRVRDREHLPEATLSKLIDALTESTTVLFDDIRFQPNAWEFRPDMPRFSRNRLAEVEHQFAMEDPGDQSGQVSEDERKFLTSLLAIMNERAAKAPEFEDALTQLNMILKLKESVDDDTKKKPEDLLALYRGIDLKLWQPQAIAWGTNMLESPSGAACIGDDTGLGKTVELCGILVEFSHRLEASRQAELVRLFQADQARYREELEETKDDPGLRSVVRPPAQVPEDLPNKGTIQHRPTLLVIPPTAWLAWRNDIPQFFSNRELESDITLRILGHSAKYHGSDVDPVMRIEPTIHGIKSFVASLDPTDPRTTRTVIMATYQSWQMKVLEANVHFELEDNTWAIRKVPKNQRLRGGDEDEEVDEDDDEEANAGEAGAPGSSTATVETGQGKGDLLDGDGNPVKIAGKKITKFVSANKLLLDEDTFGVIICDEAHRVKNKHSLQTEAVYKFNGAKYLFATATPFRTHVGDLEGLLRFPWKNLQHLYPDEYMYGTRRDYAAMYTSFIERYKGNWRAIEDEQERLQYFSALNPENYGKLIGEKGDFGVGADVVPLPTSLFVLRRVKGQKIPLTKDRVLEIGSEIPHFVVTTVELQMSPYEACLYRGIIESLGFQNKEYKSEIDPNDVEARMSLNRRRRLVLGTFNPMLDRFIERRCPNDSNSVQKYLSNWKGSTDSFTFFHRWTKSDLHTLPPTTAQERINYVVGTSSKMLYLLGIIRDVVIASQEKLIIYCDYPLTIFMVELLLELLGLTYGSIRAGIKNQDRYRAENDFNHSPQLRLLVCSSRSAAESLNLQKGGWRTVVMDVISANNLIQVIGRQCRIGQTHIQQVTVVTLDESYDQVLMARYVARYRDQVAAFSQVPEDLVFRYLLIMDQTDRTLMEIETKSRGINATTWASERLQRLYANGLIRQMFGHRTDRTPEWTDGNFMAKNLLPREALFRLSFGGAVTLAMYQLLEAEERRKAQGEDEIDPEEPLITKVKEKGPGPPKTEKLDEDKDTKGLLRMDLSRPTPFGQIMANAPTLRRENMNEARCIAFILRAARQTMQDEEHRAGGRSFREVLEMAKQGVPYPSHELVKATSLFNSDIRLSDFILKKYDHTKPDEFKQILKRVQATIKFVDGSTSASVLSEQFEHSVRVSERGDGSSDTSDEGSHSSDHYSSARERSPLDDDHMDAEAEDDLYASKEEEEEQQRLRQLAQGTGLDDQAQGGSRVHDDKVMSDVDGAAGVSPSDGLPDDSSRPVAGGTADRVIPDSSESPEDMMETDGNVPTSSSPLSDPPSDLE